MDNIYCHERLRAMISELMKKLWLVCYVRYSSVNTRRCVRKKEVESPSRGLFSRGRTVRYRKAAEVAAHCREQELIVESRSALSRAAACCREQGRMVEVSGKPRWLP
jgi:hypothetical protein